MYKVIIDKAEGQGANFESEGSSIDVALKRAVKAMTVKDRTVPLEDAGIILNGLCDFVQGVSDLKMYHIKMQRQFLQEKGITQEQLKNIETNDPGKYAEIKAEAKAWLKEQEGFIPSLPRLEKITEKPQATTQG